MEYIYKKYFKIEKNQLIIHQLCLKKDYDKYLLDELISKLKKI